MSVDLVALPDRRCQHSKTPSTFDLVLEGMLNKDYSFPGSAIRATAPNEMGSETIFG
jgi:hypothetical protein